MSVEFIRGVGMGGGIGSILYSDRTRSGGIEETFYYNTVGHVVNTTDPDGSTLSGNVYDAFGNLVSQGGSSDNNRLANTKERSLLLGLDNHGKRYYDPITGRYINPDPIGYGDGLNLYHYVHNNPVNFNDPQGLGFWDIVQGALDVASIVPGVGTAASLVNAGISVARGNYAEAALNLAAAVPGVGSAVKGASLGAKVVKAVVKGANLVNKATATYGNIQTAVAVGVAVQQGNWKEVGQIVVEEAAGRASGGRKKGGKPGNSSGFSAGTKGAGAGGAHGGPPKDSGRSSSPSPDPEFNMDRLKRSAKEVNDANRIVKGDERTWRFQDPRNPNYKEDLMKEVPRPGTGKDVHADHMIPKKAAAEAGLDFVPVGWLPAKKNTSLGGGDDKRAKADVIRHREAGETEEMYKRLGLGKDSQGSLDRHLGEWRRSGFDDIDTVRRTAGGS